MTGALRDFFPQLSLAYFSSRSLLFLPENIFMQLSTPFVLESTSVCFHSFAGEMCSKAQIVTALPVKHKCSPPPCSVVKKFWLEKCNYLGSF